MFEVEVETIPSLALSATKWTARVIGVLWMNLSGIRQRDKMTLLDSLVLSFGLFGTAVESSREVQRDKVSVGYVHYVYSPSWL